MGLCLRAPLLASVSILRFSLDPRRDFSLTGLVRRVHFIIPMQVWIITRNFWVTFTLIMAWESVEAIISGATGSLGVFVTGGGGSAVGAADAETLLDSMGGDVWIGFLGSLTGFAYTQAFDVPRFLPEGWKGYERIWVVLAFEILLFAAPTPGIQVYDPSGMLSVGWLVFLVWIPLGSTMFYAGFNGNFPVWRYRKAQLPGIFVKDAAGDKHTYSRGRIYMYERVHWPRLKQTRSVLCLGISLFLFIASFAYRFFDSVFYMVLLNGGVYQLILWIIFFATRFPTLDPNTSLSDLYVFLC